MEYSEGAVISNKQFVYEPAESEAEKASNGYLLSLLVMKAGIPMPLFNLLGTIIFYFANRRSTYFVRWHTTQLLLLQLSLFFVNATGTFWTYSIIFGDNVITNTYLAYIITAILFNIVEYILTIYTCIKARKGRHIIWWFYGALTQQICKP